MTRDELIAKARTIAGDLRQESIVKTLMKMFQREARIVVETGTIRHAQIDEGGSTLIWALYCETEGGWCVSVDIDPESIKTSRQILQGYQGRVRYQVHDSVEFLGDFQMPIDLLYLDSLDCGTENHLPSQLHQLAELGAAYVRLGTESLVLLDDCNIPGGGKGLLSAQFLEQRGWICLHNAYQKLYAQK